MHVCNNNRLCIGISSVVDSYPELSRSLDLGEEVGVTRIQEEKRN